MNHKCNSQRFIKMDGSIETVEDYSDNYGSTTSSSGNSTSTTSRNAVSDTSAIQLRKLRISSENIDSNLSSISSLKFESATKGTKRPNGMRSTKVDETASTSSSIKKKSVKFTNRELISFIFKHTIISRFTSTQESSKRNMH